MLRFFTTKGTKEALRVKGRYAFYGTRIERIKWIFKDFDSFAVMDGSGLIGLIF